MMAVQPTKQDIHAVRESLASGLREGIRIKELALILPGGLEADVSCPPSYATLRLRGMSFCLPQALR
jgi:hypothetical protein